MKNNKCIRYEYNSPNPFHESAQESADNGVHVLCEKVSPEVSPYEEDVHQW